MLALFISDAGLQHIADHIVQNTVVLIVGQLSRGIDAATAINHFLSTIRARQRDRHRHTGLQSLQVADIYPLLAAQSRLEPEPYSLPAITASGVPSAL